MTVWTSVQLPSAQIKQIEELLKQHPGYVSVAEFVRDAVREKIVKVCNDQGKPQEANPQ